MQINQWIQQQPSYYELDTSIQLTVIWKNLIKNGIQLEYEQMEMVKNNRIKQMLEWIHTHYAEKILLDDIASAGHLSRSEC